MNKPNVVTVEIGGKTRQILLCVWGLLLAEEKGFEVQTLELDFESASGRKGKFRQMLETLWIGMLPFDEDLTLRDLGMEIPFTELPAVSEAFGKVISRQLSDDIREEVERRKNEEDGKKKSRRRPVPA